MQNAHQKAQADISKAERVRFSLSFFVCSLLWMSGLGIVSAVLLPQHLKDVVGGAQATTIFGIINAVTAIASLVSNLLFGNLSDRADVLHLYVRPERDYRTGDCNPV